MAARIASIVRSPVLSERQRMPHELRAEGGRRVDGNRQMGDNGRHAPDRWATVTAVRGWMARRHAERAEVDLPTRSLGVHPGDVGELDVRFAAVDAEDRRDRDARLVARLGLVVERRVPLRVVEAVPGLRAARIRFADGTAVLARGFTPGDIGVLASWVRARSVVAIACPAGTAGVQLVFRAPGPHHGLAVRVIGFDQAD
jgi:hypothetical protein